MNEIVGFSVIFLKYKIRVTKHTKIFKRDQNSIFHAISLSCNVFEVKGAKFAVYTPPGVEAGILFHYLRKGKRGQCEHLWPQ